MCGKQASFRHHARDARDGPFVGLIAPVRNARCPVPLTVRGTQALVSFAPLALKLFYAARQKLERCSSVPLTVRGTQALVSFAPLAFKLFCAARQNAVLRRSSFPSL